MISRQLFKRILMTSAVLLALASPAAADYVRGKAAYESGNYATAYQEFKASADSGQALSQYMLARLYAEGRGVNQDYVQAHAWYNIAATNGYYPAISARDALAARMTTYQIGRAQNLASQWQVAHARPAVSAPAPTYTAAPAALPYVPYSVRNVQLALIDLGYVPGPADGIMGARTRAAIRAYQVDSGLAASGEPSLKLFEHLQRSKAERTSVAPPATTTADNSALIAEVQSELRQREYAVPAVTGRLDAATVAAIRRYQADASLPVNGQVSDGLLAQLRSGRIDEGATYRDQVRSMQTALNQRGFDAGPADGALGPKTRAAIRRYQSSAGLPVTGEMDADLMESLEVAIGTPTPAPAPGGRTQIAMIEDELLRRGYAVGSADGRLDAQSRHAIRTFQEDAGLAVTGEASASLLTTLRTSAVRNKSNTASLLVWEIEHELQRLGYTVGQIDGDLDDQTRHAIRSYQDDLGMEVNGKASANLLAQLEATDVRYSGQTSSTLAWNIENELSRRGYRPGRIDGVVDAQTTAAIRSYEYDAGLRVTGRPSEALLADLRTSNVTASGASAGDFISGVLDRLQRSTNN